MKLRTGFVSNSSSSSFVCDTKMSVKEVESSLRRLLEIYNEFFDASLKFNEVFKKPFRCTKEYQKSMTEWGYDANVGSLIIESESDNTIPYVLFDWIEEKFNGYRNHLG